jgi:hypothetical protein
VGGLLTSPIRARSANGKKGVASQGRNIGWVLAAAEQRGGGVYAQPRVFAQERN